MRRRVKRRYKGSILIFRRVLLTFSGVRHQRSKLNHYEQEPGIIRRPGCKYLDVVVIFFVFFSDGYFKFTARHPKMKCSSLTISCKYFVKMFVYFVVCREKLVRMYLSNQHHNTHVAQPYTYIQNQATL